VTPGINPGTYRPTPGADTQGAGSAGYFDRELGAVQEEEEDITALTPSQIAAGAKTTNNLLERMSLAAMGRRQSLSEIRAAHPDLSLSGNIISATFNIPHLLGYNKGADWVSLVLLAALLVYPPDGATLLCYLSVPLSNVDTTMTMAGLTRAIAIGLETPPRPICPLRLVLVLVIRRHALESHSCRLDW
jgi:hypothetical protein